ncbi:hypothetical protein IUY40_05535 [Flavobacterium sp. ALJ2]|uniref:hypothetical protein n=1 Tax=Flavobacterium sp. ALJ2 TaxID=2786960 RepID=UPI00189FFD5F|nr:hypothetical protein [Flavobacterium sp. ALJ2]MBF7090995.1 hypothetical protein [Flavobacterium sp. ALJ2]
MIEKFKEFNISEDEIEKLKNFRSRDGFAIIDGNEFNKMQNYFEQFVVYKNIVPILTDNSSNYWCLYVDGALKGMVCYLSHDELNLEPKFRNISNLIDVIDNNPDVFDFDGFGENVFEFPTTKKIVQFSERSEIIVQLLAELKIEKDEDCMQQLAFSIMALSSNNEIEATIYPFVDDEDMYVQERAIELLGFHKYKPARERLIELKTRAMPNGKYAAKLALAKINSNNSSIDLEN